MSLRIDNAAEIRPVKGELFRFVYRFSGSETIKDTWPKAIYLQVGNDPRWIAGAYATVLDRRSVVVDAEVESVPGNINYADLESMLSAVREFTMSNNTAANLVRVESLGLSEYGSGASMRASAGDTTLTTWDSPAPETITPDDQYAGNSILEDATSALGGAVQDLVSGAAKLLGATAEDIIKPTVGAVFQPGLVVVVVVVGIAYLALKKG